MKKHISQKLPVESQHCPPSLIKNERSLTHIRCYTNRHQSYVNNFTVTLWILSTEHLRPALTVDTFCYLNVLMWPILREPTNQITTLNNESLSEKIKQTKPIGWRKAFKYDLLSWKGRCLSPFTGQKPANNRQDPQKRSNLPGVSHGEIGLWKDVFSSLVSSINI